MSVVIKIQVANQEQSHLLAAFPMQLLLCGNSTAYLASPDWPGLSSIMMLLSDVECQLLSGLQDMVVSQS